MSEDEAPSLEKHKALPLLEKDEAPLLEVVAADKVPLDLLVDEIILAKAAFCTANNAAGFIIPCVDAVWDFPNIDAGLWLFWVVAVALELFSAIG